MSVKAVEYFYIGVKTLQNYAEKLFEIHLFLKLRACSVIDFRKVDADYLNNIITIILLQILIICHCFLPPLPLVLSSGVTHVKLTRYNDTIHPWVHCQGFCALCSTFMPY